MMSKEVILQKLRIFKNENPQMGIISIGLFDSVARGQCNDNSDIDICVQLSNHDFINFMMLKDKLSVLLGGNIDLVSIHKFFNPSFLEEIQNDMIYV